jgi:hypothetical protein
MAKWDKPVLGPLPPGSVDQGQTTYRGPVIGGPPGQGPASPTRRRFYYHPRPAYYNPINGEAPTTAGVTGFSNTGPGVLGYSAQVPDGSMPGSGESDGVQGISDGNGVHGISFGSAASGVWGENQGGGFGVSGSTSGGTPGLGGGTSGAGVWGNTRDATGVMGTSTNGVGVFGRGGSYAGIFDGDVMVNGNLNIGSQGDVILNDCAEHFDVVDAKTEPGTVMVIDQDGNLQPCNQPYDKKVAGVVSGAGNFKPGIILGKPQLQSKGLLIALLGKVYCKADAQYLPIEVGDLLTTSPTTGYAMKAVDPSKAFGCVLGKALRPLDKGQGLIPILIALQ